MKKQRKSPAANNEASAPTEQSVLVDLGIPSVVELEHPGYLPSRPEVVLSPYARRAVKRLAVTLDQSEATLQDGTLVKNSVQKSIAWLCEKLADSIC